jgi:hypothetical protein
MKACVQILNILLAGCGWFVEGITVLIGASTPIPGPRRTNEMSDLYCDSTKDVRTLYPVVEHSNFVRNA